MAETANVKAKKIKVLEDLRDLGEYQHSDRQWLNIDVFD